MSIKPEGKILYKETRRILRNAKENNRLVLFVGAGTSVDPEMPLWSEAIEQIASKIPFFDKDKMYDPLRIPQYYYNSRGKKLFVPDAGRKKISAGNILVMEGDYRSDWQDRGFVSGRSFYGKYSEYDFAVSGWSVTSDRMGSENVLVERIAVWYNMLGWD